MSPEFSSPGVGLSNGHNGRGGPVHQKLVSHRDAQAAALADPDARVLRDQPHPGVASDLDSLAGVGSAPAGAKPHAGRGGLETVRSQLQKKPTASGNPVVDIGSGGGNHPAGSHPVLVGTLHVTDVNGIGHCGRKRHGVTRISATRNRGRNPLPLPGGPPPARSWESGATGLCSIR